MFEDPPSPRFKVPTLQRRIVLMSYHFTRRGFLKGTAVAAGVIVLSGTFKTNAYAANSKLDVAIVGVGGQGGAGHGFMKSENCVAMCDADEARMGKLDIAGAKKYTDWRKMFDAHPKMNMVWVATPDHTHFPVAYMAVTMGMGCYCEKPLVHDVWEARILAEATKKMKVPTQMGNQGHAGQGIRRMVEWIQAGAIGDVKEGRYGRRASPSAPSAARRPPTSTGRPGSAPPRCVRTTRRITPSTGEAGTTSAPGRSATWPATRGMASGGRWTRSSR
jgi:hypothetical protein